MPKNQIITQRLVVGETNDKKMVNCVPLSSLLQIYETNDKKNVKYVPFSS